MTPKKLTLAIGFGALIAGMVVNFITFTVAYFTPGYEIVVNVASYGEQHIEFFLLCATFPLVLAFIYWAMKHLKEMD